MNDSKLKNKPMKPLLEFCSLTEAAAYLDMHVVTLNKLLKKNEIPYYTMNERKRILKKDLTEYVKRSYVNGAEKENNIDDGEQTKPEIKNVDGNENNEKEKADENTAKSDPFGIN